jgi:hypothetical protein
MIREMLVEELNNAFDKRSWHGASLISALRVSPAVAAKRVAGRHTIWEQLLHAAYWKHRVLLYLGSKEKFPRPGSDWIAMPKTPNAAAWKKDLELLRKLQAKLILTVMKLPDSGLNDRKTRWLLHGGAAHDLYHAGQIKLLRRLVR